MEVYLTSSVEYNQERYKRGYIYDFPKNVAERLLEVGTAKLPEEVQLDVMNKEGVVSKVAYERRKAKIIDFLDLLTVKDLRKIASEKEVVNYADLRKEELIEQLIVDI